MSRPAIRPAQAALASLACEFNLRPDNYIHPSWLRQAWPGQWGDPASLGPRGRTALARVLSRRYGLDEATHFDFSREEFRLALLPPAVLARLGDDCGLCLHRESLREAGGRRLQRALNDTFGEAALAFIMQRVPPFDAIAESIEPLRQYPELAAARIRERGARLVLDFLAPAGKALLDRLQLKFPFGVAAQPPYLLNGMQRQQVSELIFLCLIPERLGEWDWLF